MNKEEKTILKILIKIKEELEIWTKQNRVPTTLSLCTISRHCGGIVNHEIFKSYLYVNHKPKIYYNHLNQPTKDYSQFHWMIGDTQSRLDWLTEQINILENE